MTESGMNPQEESRLLAMVKKEGGVLEGDKCPMDKCRGLLQLETRVLFSHDKDPAMFGFEVFQCDRKRCKFTGFVSKEESERIEKWRS